METGHKVQIIIAVIGVIGGIGAALVANYCSMFNCKNDAIPVEVCNGSDADKLIHGNCLRKKWELRDYASVRKIARKIISEKPKNGHALYFGGEVARIGNNNLDRTFELFLKYIKFEPTQQSKSNTRSCKPNQNARGH